MMTTTLNASRFAMALMLGVSSVALLGACSGKTTSAAPIARTDITSEYAKALCESIQGCCSTGQMGYDQAACEAAAKAQLDQELPTTSAGYDANAAGSCLAEIRGVWSSCADAPETAAPSCQRVFFGSKNPGEACTSSFDCALPAEGHAECNSFGTTSGSGRQCIVVRTAQKGDACISTSAAPPAGKTFGDCYSAGSPFYCDNVSSTCQPRKSAGDACQFDNDCAEGNTCTSGKCASAPSEGQSCSFTCAKGFYCDFASATCRAQIKAGAACDTNGPSPCADDGRCDNGKCSAGPTASAETCTGKVSSTN